MYFSGKDMKCELIDYGSLELRSAAHSPLKPIPPPKFCPT